MTEPCFDGLAIADPARELTVVEVLTAALNLCAGMRPDVVRDVDINAGPNPGVAVTFEEVEAWRWFANVHQLDDFTEPEGFTVRSGLIHSMILPCPIEVQAYLRTPSTRYVAVTEADVRARPTATYRRRLTYTDVGLPVVRTNMVYIGQLSGHQSRSVTWERVETR